MLCFFCPFIRILISCIYFYKSTIHQNLYHLFGKVKADSASTLYQRRGYVLLIGAGDNRLFCELYEMLVAFGGFWIIDQSESVARVDYLTGFKA